MVYIWRRWFDVHQIEKIWIRYFIYKELCDRIKYSLNEIYINSKLTSEL